MPDQPTFNFDSDRREFTLSSMRGPAGPNSVTTATATDLVGLLAGNATNVYVPTPAQGRTLLGLGSAALSAVADFAAASHSHPLSALTQSSATTNQVPAWNGTAWVPTTPASGAAAAGTLTGATLAANVLNTSITSTGVLTGLSVDTSSRIDITSGATGDVLRVIRKSDGAILSRMPSHSSAQFRTNIICGGIDTIADDGEARFWFYSGSTPKLLLSGSFALFASDVPIRWDSGTAVNGSPNVGIASHAAGVLRVTNGSTGYGSLIAGSRATADTGLTLQGVASQTGQLLELWGVSSTPENRRQAAVTSSFPTPTDATRQGELSLSAVGIVSAVETVQTGLTIAATASGVASLGFFGGAVAAKPTGVAVTAAGIHAALVTLGLIAS